MRVRASCQKLNTSKLILILFRNFMHGKVIWSLLRLKKFKVKDKSNPELIRGTPFARTFIKSISPQVPVIVNKKI